MGLGPLGLIRTGANSGVSCVAVLAVSGVISGGCSRGGGCGGVRSGGGGSGGAVEPAAVGPVAPIAADGAPLGFPRMAGAKLARQTKWHEVQSMFCRVCRHVYVASCILYLAPCILYAAANMRIAKREVAQSQRAKRKLAKRLVMRCGFK